MFQPAGIQNAKVKTGRQASFGKSRDTATGKKTNLAFRFKFTRKPEYMAKSIRLSEVETQRAHMGAPLSCGSFWEHWFDAQTQGQRPLAIREEHSIWERAVNLEILALDDKKD